MTSINGRYKNTQEAPTAELYDRLRQQSPQQLAISFQPFEQRLIEELQLIVDDIRVPVKVISINIPEPGYTQVPRTSVITLGARISNKGQSLKWYYPSEFGDHAVRVRLIDADRDFWHWSDYQWIRDDSTSKPFDLGKLIDKTAWYTLLYQYVEAGYLHILPYGADHILFIFGLFLLSLKLSTLLWQVSLFTLAHSITLSLYSLGLINLPASVVEPLIALSITYVALENLWQSRLSRSRLWVVFTFGLLHGLGFAAMLAEFGLPEDRFLLALIGFNLGVEAGQISILLIAWCAVGFWSRHWSGYKTWLVRPASVLIACIGLVWFWQRLPWSSL